MTRAGEPCPEPNCPNLKPCAEHPREAWQRRSKRRTKLSGSKQQARARYIIRRDQGRCHRCGHYGADQADHVIPLEEGGPDRASNMRAIHAEPCHRLKTAEEAQRARARERVA